MWRPFCLLFNDFHSIAGFAVGTQWTRRHGSSRLAAEDLWITHLQPRFSWSCKLNLWFPQTLKNAWVWLLSWKVFNFYTPCFNEVERGVYWYHLVRPSVCPSVDRIVSALYLQQYLSDPFHICTSYQATSGVSRVMPVSKFKNLKFWQFFKICNFDFVFFWLGIQYDSMVWVIMRRRGVSSERRRSSCSSSICLENWQFSLKIAWRLLFIGWKNNAQT